MIGTLSPYPKMKESGIDWLGKVPDHWELRRLRASVDTCSNGVWGADPDGRYDLVCVRVADFDRVRRRVDMGRKTVRAIAPKERRGRLLNKGDLLLEKSGGGDLQPVGTVVMYDHDVPAVCSNFVARMSVAPDFDPWYLAYLHSCVYCKRINVRSIKQTTGIQNLDSSAYLNEEAAFPPLSEQTVIARFLDRADRRIRRYISAKQKLIALLEEQQKTIIHQAVTGEIDVHTGQRYPAYKPSRVGSLEEVPAHWSVRRVKQVSHIQGGFAFSSEMFGDRGIPAIRMNDIERGSLCLDNAVRIPEHQCKVGFALKEGDILYGLSGSVGETGSLGNYAAVKRADLPAQLNQRVARLQPRPDELVGMFLFLAVQTQTFYEQVLAHTSGTAQFNVSTRDIGNVAIALPPVDEQQRIVQWFSFVSARIGVHIERSRRQIDLLGEYRTRLVTDVVTGKVDVRERTAAFAAGTASRAEDVRGVTCST